MKKKVLWLVVTGLDGSGKTTLLDDIEKWLKDKGLRVYRTRSPHDQYLVKTLLNVSGNGLPMGDPYTDRMIMALDNRILSTRLRGVIESGEYDIIISQRGFFDSFVHGAVQGYSYNQVADLNRIYDLLECDIMCHLCAEATVAYSRICDDPDADKFETPEYIVKQEAETRRGYREVKNGNPELGAFKDTVNFLIDTSEFTTQDTFEMAKRKLMEIESFKELMAGFESQNN